MKYFCGLKKLIVDPDPVTPSNVKEFDDGETVPSSVTISKAKSIVIVLPDPDVTVPDDEVTFTTLAEAVAVPASVTKEIGTSLGTSRFVNLIDPA